METGIAKQKNLTDWALLASLVVLWGSSFMMIDLAVRDLAPDWVVAGRLVVATLLLMPFALRGDASAFRSPQMWGWFVLLGIIGNVGPFYLITWGQQFIPSSTAGIIIAVNPLLTLFAASLIFPEEKLTPLRAGGFIICFIGVAVLMGGDALAGIEISGPALIGQIAVLGAACLFAGNTILSRSMPQSPFMVRAAGTQLAAALISLPAAALIEPITLAGLSHSALVAVFCLGLLSTALSTVVFFVIIDRQGPSFVATSAYLVPLWAVFVGVVALGEPLHLRALIALALILGGIALSESRWPPRQLGPVR